MTQEKFYELMNSFEPTMTFEQCHKQWLKCFSYMLKHFNVGWSDTAIKDIFYHFSMENAKMFWKAYNPEYSECTTEQLLSAFCGECRYICDRYSYDRIFRAHWLFLRSFDDEIDKFKYPSLYK